MSEEAAAPKEKKKGGKLPIIVAVVLMLAGGGFFMMKGKGKKVEKPKVVLGEAEVVLPDEFIVNLADGRTYVRCKIGLRPKAGYAAEEVTKHDAEISDVINRVLKTTKPEETVTEKQINKLKKRIATELNKVLEVKHEEEEPEKDSKSKKGHKKEKEEEDAEEIPDGWDSAEGPILKIFFKTFTTQ